MASTMSLYSALSLAPTMDTRTCVSLRGIWKISGELWYVTDTCTVSASPEAYRKVDSTWFLRPFVSDMVLPKEFRYAGILGDDFWMSSVLSSSLGSTVATRYVSIQRRLGIHTFSV